MSKRSEQTRIRRVEHDGKTSWEFVTDVGIDPKTGKRRQARRRGFATRKEAQDTLTELRKQRIDNTFIPASKQTVAEFIVDWLAALRNGKLRPSSLYRYEVLARTHLVPRIGGVKLAALSPETLNAMYGDLLAAGLSARTVRYVHVTAHRMLRDAVKWGRLLRNVAALAEPPAGQQTMQKVWSSDQLRTFLTYLEGEEDRLHGAYRLIAMTGLRRGEALGLRDRDVDLETGTASIVQTITTIGNEAVFSEPKTKRGRRQVSLDPGTVATLRIHRARRQEERIAIGLGRLEPDDLFFAMPDGWLVHPNKFSRWFQAHSRRAGVPVIREHDLRHTFATLALQAGVPLKIVSEMLGHSTLAITGDLYSHVTPGMQQDAAARVARLIT